MNVTSMGCASPIGGILGVPMMKHNRVGRLAPSSSGLSEEKFNYHDSLILTVIYIIYIIILYIYSKKETKSLKIC